jgi:hypothetical protein
MTKPASPVTRVEINCAGYNGVDLCTTKCNEEQKEWLKKDLAAVDRSKTPWWERTNEPTPIKLSTASSDKTIN